MCGTGAHLWKKAVEPLEQVRVSAEDARSAFTLRTTSGVSDLRGGRAQGPRASVASICQLWAPTNANSKRKRPPAAFWKAIHEPHRAFLKSRMTSRKASYTSGLEVWKRDFTARTYVRAS